MTKIKALEGKYIGRVNEKRGEKGMNGSETFEKLPFENMIVEEKEGSEICKETW